MRKLLLAFTAFLSLTAMAQTQIAMPLPAQSSTFSSNVRGYYFVAPTCFTITGIQVPTDASTADQSIAIVRFWNNQIPPLYSATTNAFTILYLTQNNTNSGILPVNIQVEQGDVIGILGQRGTTNSYGTAGFVSTIDGFPVTLNRLGMQFPLTTTTPQQLWTENGGSISRVTMFYDSLITYNVTSTPTGPTSFDFNNGADTSFTSSWDFGDGSPLGTGSTVSHTYAVGGTYNVCTYITTSCGTDTLCTTVSVCNPSPAVAGFSSSSVSSTVTFTDASTNASGWSWDFGDGSPIDNTQNPVHTYAVSGTYTVCLIANNFTCDADTICTSVTVCIPTTTNFGLMQDTSGAWVFTDSSVNATMWMWDFGDGDTSMMQNPTHMYTLNGTYNICLVSMDCASDTMCTTITTCPEVLTATFVSTDTLMDATFTSNAPTAVSYWWDFGDGNFDSIANPTHTYANTGLYTVCLTVWNLCGDSITTCDTVLLVITDIAVNGNAEIGVYPNPATTSATVMVTSAEYTGNYVFEITDAAGKLVRVENGVFGQQLNFSRDNMAAGTYIYKVRVNEVVLGNGKLMFTE